MVARTEFAIDLVVNPRTAEPGLRKLDRRLDKTEQKAMDLRGELQKALGTRDKGLNRTLRRTNKNLERSEKRAKDFGRTLRNVFAAVGTGLAIRQLIRFGDEFTNLQNQLRVVSSSQDEASQSFERLLGIANRTRQGIGSVVTLYQRGTAAARELGASQQQLLTFVERVGQGLATTGRSAAESSGALLQLSQALGAGIVRAEEFNSILEGARPIAEAAAIGIERAGGSVSQLRNLIIKGEITSKEFFDGFLKGSDKIAQQFSETQAIVGGSFVALRNETVALVGALDRNIGALTGFSSATAAATEGVKFLRESLDGFTGRIREVEEEGQFLGKVIQQIEREIKNLESREVISDGALKQLDRLNARLREARGLARQAQNVIPLQERTESGLTRRAQPIPVPGGTGGGGAAKKTEEGVSGIGQAFQFLSGAVAGAQEQFVGLNEAQSLFNEDAELSAEFIQQEVFGIDNLRQSMAAAEEQSKTFGAGVANAFQSLKEEAEDLAFVGESVVNVFADRATDALVEFARTGQLSFKEFASAVLDDLIRIIARLLIVQALSAFVPGAPAAGGAISGLTANLGRQRGGTVQPGQAIKVGEDGREELFVPGRTGTVVPTGAIAAAAAAPQEPPKVTIINQVDPDETAAELDSGNLDEQVLNVIARNPERARTLMGRA